MWKRIEKLGRLTILQKIMDGKLSLIRSGQLSADDRSRLLSELADLKIEIAAVKEDRL